MIKNDKFFIFLRAPFTYALILAIRILSKLAVCVKTSIFILWLGSDPAGSPIQSQRKLHVWILQENTQSSQRACCRKIQIPRGENEWSVVTVTTRLLPAGAMKQSVAWSWNSQQIGIVRMSFVEPVNKSSLLRAGRNLFPSPACLGDFIIRN